MEVCKHSLGDQAVIMPSHQPEFCLGARVRCNHYEMGWNGVLFWIHQVPNCCCLSGYFTWVWSSCSQQPAWQVPPTWNSPSHTRASSQSCFSCLLVFVPSFSTLLFFNCVCQCSQPYQFAIGHLLPLPFVALRLASVCSLALFFFFRPEERGENPDECSPKDDKRQTDSVICSTWPLLSFPFLLLTHARLHRAPH